MTRKKVLFLCGGNSCRSQMAEGWVRALKRDVIDPYSAGLSSHGLNRVAVKVMAEAGVDISAYRSKRLDQLAGIEFDYVVTVCDDASEQCPIIAGNHLLIHVGFDDPPRLAAIASSEEEALGIYRRVRDEIRLFVETLPEGFDLMSAGRQPKSDPGAVADDDTPGALNPGWRSGLS